MFATVMHWEKYLGNSFTTYVKIVPKYKVCHPSFQESVASVDFCWLKKHLGVNNEGHLVKVITLDNNTLTTKLEG